MPLDKSNMAEGIRKANARVVAEAINAIRAVALETYSELTTPISQAVEFGSPVASGRFVSSMRIGINQIDTTTSPPDPGYHYPAGKGPRALPPRTIANNRISAASAKLQAFTLGDTVYITNSVPYVRRIEVGGHSWQAPNGVFGPTVRNVIRKFADSKLRISTSV